MVNEHRNLLVIEGRYIVVALHIDTGRQVYDGQHHLPCVSERYCHDECQQ